MVCAGYMMLGELLLGRSQRWLAVAMFGTALLYAALNAGLYAVVLMHSHPFSIFDPCFMLSAIVLAPGAVIIGSFVAAVRGSRLPASFPSLGIAGLTLWMIGVGAANLWVIAEASAAV